jgi:hypothetical protein
MNLSIPDHLAAKANTFPESSYGATTVTLILSDGTCIRDVILGGGSEIVKVKGRHVSDARELDFGISEVVDVIPNHRLVRVILTGVAHWVKTLTRAFGTCDFKVASCAELTLNGEDNKRVQRTV